MNGDEGEPNKSDAGFELVMPFVTVQSHGGPHDDDAYTAGFEMGKLDATLACLALNPGVTWRPPLPLQHVNVPQADLIAMRHGYRMVVQPWGDDIDSATDAEWKPVEFIPEEPAP